MSFMHRCPHFSLLALLTLSCPSIAENRNTLVLKENAPSTYVVQQGDTLWDISALYLSSPWHWPTLWQANSEIKNPHLIYPGDKLSLSWVNGQPRLSLKPIKKLSPTVRAQVKSSPSISVTLPYLPFDLLVESDALDEAVKVMGTSEGFYYLANEQNLYVKTSEPAVKWGIYRPVNQFSLATKPNNQSFELADKITALKKIASAKMISQNHGVTELKVTRLLQEIKANDIALPTPESTLSHVFEPKPAAATDVARILGTFDNRHYASKDKLVVLDKGMAENISEGTVFSLYKQAAALFQRNNKFNLRGDGHLVELPNKYLGELMVIRSYDKFSLALITKSLGEINQQTLLVSPLLSKEGKHTQSTD